MPESEVITNFAPRIKVADQSPAYKIFHYRFICIVKQMHLYGKEYLKQAGFTDSGNAQINREMANFDVHVQLSVAAMAELFYDGVSVTLSQPEDSLRIYQMIYDHLTDWQVKLRDNVFITSAPIEDLRKLDNLAGEIYKVAKYYWKNKPYHGGFFQFLDNSSRGITRARQITKAKPEPPTDQHKPMVDGISADLSKRTTPWR